jgi:hypothetical protein
MRGDVQRMTMSHEVLWRAMGFLDSICTLTITGGEPSLAPEVLEDLWDILIWRKIDVGAFYIVSNGMNHNRYRRFLTVVDKLYGWCDSQDECALTISRDQFHPFNPNKHLSKFETRDEYGHHWGEFPPYFRPEDRKHRIEKVRNEGRASVTQVATYYDQEQQEPWILDSGDYVTNPEVYIAANGNVVSACNMSFERIDEESKGNVLTQSLPDIIESYCTVKEEQEEVAA